MFVVLALAACREDEALEPPQPLPSQLLSRILHEASRQPREVSARVAAGALTTTSTSQLGPVADAAGQWAAEADALVLREVADVLRRRGAKKVLEGLETKLSKSKADVLRLSALVAEAEAGRSQARSGLAALRDPEAADEVRMALVRGLTDRGAAKEAQAVARGFRDRRRQEEALAHIAQGQAERGRTSQTLAILAPIRSPHLRGAALATLAEAEYRRGRRRAGLERAKNLESQLLRAEALANLGQAAVHARRSREGRHLFEQARNVAEGIDDPLLRGTALAHVAQRLEAVGRNREAQAVLTAIPAAAAAPVRAERIQRWVRRGRLEAAQKEAKTLDAPGVLIGEAKAALALLEAQRGQLDRALDRARSIAIPALRWRTLGAVAGAQARAEINPPRLAVVQAILTDLY